MPEKRLYRVILQVALEVEGDDDTDWYDVEQEIRDWRNWEYDLMRPDWSVEIVSALLVDPDPAHIDGLEDGNG